MAQALPSGVGSFRESSLDQDALFDTMVTFSTTVTTTRMTSVTGSGQGPRILRPVTKADEHLLAFTPYYAEIYRVPGSWGKAVRKGQLSKKRRGQIEPLPGGLRVVAVSQGAFGRGGERNVFHLRIGRCETPPN